MQVFTTFLPMSAAARGMLNCALRLYQRPPKSMNAAIGSTPTLEAWPYWAAFPWHSTLATVDGCGVVAQPARMTQSPRLSLLVLLRAQRLLSPP